jgi:hypothetical protein
VIFNVLLSSQYPVYAVPNEALKASRLSIAVLSTTADILVTESNKTTNESPTPTPIWLPVSAAVTDTICGALRCPHVPFNTGLTEEDADPVASACFKPPP